MQQPPRGLRRQSSLREFVGHDAEHQAKHRIAEKAGFAVAEQSLHVGEAVATRFADDVARAAAAAATVKPSFFRRAKAPPPTPPSLLARVARRTPGFFWALRVLVPAFGVWLLAHLARADAARARREWKDKKLRSTTLLFWAAALCDALDALVHAFVAVAHASGAADPHTVHAAEEWGIRIALVGFACAVVAEVASNNRVGRGLQRLAHRANHRKSD